MDWILEHWELLAKVGGGLLALLAAILLPRRKSNWEFKISFKRDV